MASSVFINPGGSSGSGATLPTAPLGQVLVSQGDGVTPIFSPVIRLHEASQAGWIIESVAASGNFKVTQIDAAGVSSNKRIELDPFQAGITTPFGSIVTSNSNVGARFFSIGGTLVSEIPGISGIAVVGNLLNITDSGTNTPGATVSGGGSFNVLARYNGTIWKVIQ